MTVNPSGTIKILTDNVELKPGKDFERLSDTIVSFIRGSDPKFTVGIYGDWGTGKTTLMKQVEKKIMNGVNPQNGNTLTIWFNAWRYEREEQLATIALLKTLAFGMSKHEKYKKVSTSIWNGLKIIGKDLLKQFFTQLILTEEGWNEIQTKLTEKMKLLQQFDQETIYFDGLKSIEDEMGKIRETDPNSRIVVFIDDLDRCSPKKALEVLESIKVFLDIRGFVFILGLSDRTMMRLISKEYVESGVGGEEYIQKIIQVPIRISDWHPSDIEKIIEQKIQHKIDKKYADLILENKNLISIAIKPNPRELKRFVNNIIISSEVFAEQIKNNEIKNTTLLVVEALKTRWFDFYREFMLDSVFRNEIIICLKTPDFISIILPEIREQKEEEVSDIDKKLRSWDSELWNFLFNEKVKKSIMEVKDWDTYRKISEATPKSPKTIMDDYRKDERFVTRFDRSYLNPEKLREMGVKHGLDPKIFNELESRQEYFPYASKQARELATAKDSTDSTRITMKYNDTMAERERLRKEMEKLNKKMKK